MAAAAAPPRVPYVHQNNRADLLDDLTDDLNMEKCSYVCLMVFDWLVKSALNFFVINKFICAAEGWYYPEFVTTFSIFYGISQTGLLFSTLFVCS